MNARSKLVRHELLKEYKEISNRCEIHVFCVSNKDYGFKSSCQEYNDLSAIGSGIPELRGYCHSVVAAARSRAVKYFLQVEIHGLVQMLENWVAALDLEKPPTIPSDCVQKLHSVKKRMLMVVFDETYLHLPEYRT